MTSFLFGNKDPLSVTHRVKEVTDSHGKKTRISICIYRYLILFWIKLREVLGCLLMIAEQGPCKSGIRFYTILNELITSPLILEWKRSRSKYYQQVSFQITIFSDFLFDSEEPLLQTNREAKRSRRKNCLKEMTDKNFHFSLHKTNTLWILLWWKTNLKLAQWLPKHRNRDLNSHEVSSLPSSFTYSSLYNTAFVFSCYLSLFVTCFSNFFLTLGFT